LPTQFNGFWHVWTQLPLEQQPPLHGAEELHDTPHTPVEQAIAGGQSAALAQPHCPFDRHDVPWVEFEQDPADVHPHEPLMHCLPAGDPVQSTHDAPVVPQAMLVVPVWHTVPLQHPPLHSAPPAHDVVQTFPTHA
jgi:hypothetical protein